MPSSFARYLLVFGTSAVAVLGIVWVYVAVAPLAFMESGYAAWAAKSAMLTSCQLGQVSFFGDSRLEAGVIPAALPVESSNFGLAAGTAVEARSAIDRAMACPTKPRQAVIALVPEHFGPLSQFYWLLSIRYGFLSAGDVLATERLASDLGDTESFSTATPDGLHGPARDWLYVARFPSLSFSSLVQGRVFGRLESNRARLAQVTAARGWARYDGGPEVVSQHPDRFVRTKLQTAELEAAIAALRTHGVETIIMLMPFAQTHAESQASFDGYREYLTALAAHTPGLRLLNDSVPFWPDRLFADGAHLNEEGARAFTARLAACFADGRLRDSCDLAWR